MRGVLQTCKSKKRQPGNECNGNIFSKTSIDSASLSGMSKSPNKYNLAILNTRTKSKENINSNDVPTDFCQKTQLQYTKVLKIWKKSLDFLVLQN